MGLPRKAPKTSGLLVAAIRKLRNIHGSTSREITNYVAAGCDGPSRNIKRQMKLALRRGLTTGVLHRSKNGYYTCAAFDGLEVPGDRSRGRCGKRRKSRRRRSCRKRRRRSRKRGCGRRRRKRRGMKCKKRRRSCRRRSRRRRKGKKCRGRRHDDGVEVDALATGRKTVRKQRPKSKNASKSSSQMRVSSASSGGTQRSGADTLSATLSASGKESLTDQSDISRTSDGTSGEAKP